MTTPYKGLPDPIALVNSASTANRVNSVTPTGSGTWTPGKNGGPATYTEKLTPGQQTIFNQQQTNQGQQGKVLGSALGNARGELSDPTLDFSKIPKMAVNPGRTGQNAIMSRLAPQIQREKTALHTQLVNWGLQPGTEAYNEAMARQGEQENDLLTRAALTGINLDTEAHRQGVSDQQAAINTPLNAISTLNNLAGRGEAPYSPGSGVAGSTPDVMGAWNAMNNANIAASNSKNQNTMDWLNLGVSGAKAIPDITDWMKEMGWWP